MEGYSTVHGLAMLTEARGPFVQRQLQSTAFSPPARQSQVSDEVLRAPPFSLLSPGDRTPTSWDYGMIMYAQCANHSGIQEAPNASLLFSFLDFPLWGVVCPASIHPSL